MRAIPPIALPANSFASRDRVVQSWYPAARSRDLRRGRVEAFTLLDRKLIAWRDDAGAAHVFDSRCPHLGADLAQGEVRGGSLRCPFHHWKFGGDGRCSEAPGCASLPERAVRSYAVVERWGLVWFFAGPEPLFALPDESDPAAFRLKVLASQESRANAHLLTSNLVDQSHMPALHRLDLVGPPAFEIADYRTCIRSRLRPQQGWLRLATGTRREPLDATFRTFGCNTSLIEVAGPIRFQVLFSGRPEGAGTRIFPLLRLPRGAGLDWARALLLVGRLTREDHRLLEDLQFVPGFVESDGPLKRFYDQVNATPVF